MRFFLLVVTALLIGSSSAGARPLAVDPIRQPSEMSCWAAATTMLYNWRTGIRRTIPEVLAIAGPEFVRIYQASFSRPPMGIAPAQEAALYRRLGFTVVQGQNPSIEGWRNMLSANGPLSITVDAEPGRGYIHALVVTGIDGDGSSANTIVTYIDPADGQSHDVSFDNFLRLYEGSASWPLQIIHN